MDPILRTMWLANAASGAAAVAVRVPGPVLMGEPGRVRRDAVVASDLEVVTITDRSVILTWTTRTRNRAGRLRPVGADTEVRVGPVDGVLRVRHFDARRTPFHWVEIDGLEPGRQYRFEAYSDGNRARSARTLVTRRAGTPESTGVFRTLTPPPGRLLRTFALANDLHFGEDSSGLLVSGLAEGLRHATAHYPEFMFQAVLDELRGADRGADHLVVAGDLTDSGTREQTCAVRAQLDTWGVHGRDYFVCRGNHDMPPKGEADHFGAVFHPHRQLVEYFVGGMRLIGLDTTRPRGSGGTLDAAQLDRLRELLAADPDRPTLVFGHHPVTRHAAVSNPGGPGFVLDRPNAAALHEIYRASPGVFLHHSGHTHRNRVTRADSQVNVEFLEVAAVKEYPGGYTLLRVYEGGYMINFYKTRSAAARRWSTRTRSQYLGLHPDHALGSCADRNHVVPRDFSGLTGC
ncbi:metallophosphoesterase [Nocardia yamanashiensis]|uniref:metallophosphoesterase n=1 Tax=Nocardia yamanashiensis TaxID=209247 RepID=UPI001E37E104|nr:metallophosphoesterase [Nocardia yamanashiensis]UGT44398.1 metallophosphoesterase [Nocardia yamanashiensis]